MYSNIHIRTPDDVPPTACRVTFFCPRCRCNVDMPMVNLTPTSINGDGGAFVLECECTRPDEPDPRVENVHKTPKRGAGMFKPFTQIKFRDHVITFTCDATEQGIVVQPEAIRSNQDGGEFFVCISTPPVITVTNCARSST